MRRNTYPRIGRQKGLGYIGYMLVLSVCIFLGLFGFKVGTHYFENWTITSVAQELASKPEVLKQPRSKVYQYLNQAYRTNNLWNVKAEDTITLTRDGKKGYLVTVQYEKRSKLFHNIHLVTSFDEVAYAAP